VVGTRIRFAVNPERRALTQYCFDARIHQTDPQRGRGDSIVIELPTGELIEIMVVRVNGKQVRLGTGCAQGPACGSGGVAGAGGSLDLRISGIP